MPSPSRRPASLREAAALALDAEGDSAAFGRAIAEFLDEFYTKPGERQAMIANEPLRVGRFEDAYLGGVAEHLARRWNLAIPGWVDQPHRFLDRAHFAGGLESLKAILLAESPLAFRKRQIFVEAEPLRRARMPRDEAVA
jgi:hypothetical protein